jgi:hypothetical protein
MFELSKWYADCVGGGGDAVVAYYAELRWQGLAIRYGSVMEHRKGTGTECAYSLRRSRGPAIQGGVANWKMPPLQFAGSWCALNGPIEATVFESRQGAVRWHCLQPRSRAVAQAGGAFQVSGLGYLEHLRLSVTPWQIPIDQLRWGRFLSETDAIVWIDWRGAHARRLVFHNGAEIASESITEKGVVLTTGVLSFENSEVLREGRLGETALGTVSNVRKIFPARILGVREAKWISRAVLEKPDGAQTSGWAIHEVVEWP